MKFKYLFLVFSALACLFVVANSQDVQAANIFEPQWSEFCPPNYQYATFRKGKKAGMYSENNYWAVRRAEFERAKKQCRSYTDMATQNACYQRLVDIERNKTVQRKSAKAERYYEEDREIREQYYY